MRTGRLYLVMKSSVSSRMPDSPASRFFQVESRSPPNEVVATMEVTTTLGKFPPSVEYSRREEGVIRPRLPRPAP